MDPAWVEHRVVVRRGTTPLAARRPDAVESWGAPTAGLDHDPRRAVRGLRDRGQRTPAALRGRGAEPPRAQPGAPRRAPTAREPGAGAHPDPLRPAWLRTVRPGLDLRAVAGARA